MQDLTLITALGTNSDLVLELLDFFNGGERFWYSNEALQIRNKFAGQHLVRLYLLCTADTQVQQTAEKVREIMGDEYPRVELRSIPLPFSDLKNAADDEVLKQIVYREIHEKVAAGERLVIASAGRKTVTHRLIEAGLMYGCDGYLSITTDSMKRENVRYQTESFNVLWIPAQQFSRERRKNLETVQEGIGNNFRSLYLLPTAVIERLRMEKVGLAGEDLQTHLSWLQRLPKADLHCHLGGAFSPSLLLELAKQLSIDLDIDLKTIRPAIEKQLNCSLSRLDNHILRGYSSEGGHCLKGLNKLFSLLDYPAHQIVAAMVTALSEEQISDLSYDGMQDTGIRAKELDWYMKCGDLGGSSLLQSDGSLRAALKWLMETAYNDGCLYLEVRCSPENYCRAGMSVRSVMECLIDEGRKFMEDQPGFRVNFLIMATRHKSSSAMDTHVSAAVIYSQPGEENDACITPKVVGFDLAGQEKDHDPALYAEHFLPLHRHFINITIHAGEMEEDDKIWQALYLLHAKRIGHGLKLVNNARMMGYVRDYGIAIELCPSSNIQTNSFCLYGEKEKEGGTYPLVEYLRRGINTTVNTDNLGISKTTLSKELLLAGKLTDGGLSRWEILQLCRNSLRSVFLPKDEKDRLMKEADKMVYELILEEYLATP